MTATTVLNAEEPGAIERAARLLCAGEIVAFPTDTLYALGADATSERAIAALFALKSRAETKPLIVLCAALEEAERHAVFDARARRVARAFWPGPLSLVLRRREGSAMAPAVSAGTGTVALRVPRRAVTLSLLRAAGRPLAAPSANRSGEPPPATAEGVAEIFDAALPLVLDAGPSRGAAPSTLLDLSGAQPVLLRQGAIAREALAALVGHLAEP